MAGTRPSVNDWRPSPADLAAVIRVEMSASNLMRSAVSSARASAVTSMAVMTTPMAGVPSGAST